MLRPSVAIVTFDLVMNGTSHLPSDVVELTYGPILLKLAFEDLRALQGKMEELLLTPGFQELAKYFGQESDFVKTQAIQTGELDKHMAGIMAGYERIIRFPQLVCRIYEEVDAQKAQGGASNG